MELTTREIKFKDENGQMVSALILGNGSVEAAVDDWCDENLDQNALVEILGDTAEAAVAEWCEDNIDQTAVEEMVVSDVAEIKNEIDDANNGVMSITLINDKYVRMDNGALGNYVDWSATDFIPVEGLTTVYIYSTVASNYNAFYTSNDQSTFVQSFGTVNGLSSIGIPAGVKYMRLSNTTTAMESTTVYNLWRSSEKGLRQELQSISGSKNILDDVTWVEDHSIIGDGSITSSSGFRYSDLIPISDGNYYLAYIPNGQNRNTRIHGYDSNGDWVKQVAVSASYSGTTPIVFSFKCSGVASIRISAGSTRFTHLIGLYTGLNMTALDNNMVWEPIPMSSGEITINNNTAYIVDYSIYINTDNPNARCSVVECSGGDLFTINARGANGPRAYAFVDANDKILEMPKGGAEIHGVFKAPNGSTKLVINDYWGLTSYKAVEPTAGYNKLSEVQSVTPVTLGSKNWVARLGWETNLVGSGAPPVQSIASYKMAYDHNCRIMLADLQITADNIIVCLHDTTLDSYCRHTDGTALSTQEKAQLVKDLTLAELNAYDWGIFCGKIYAGTTVLTMDEFLRFCSYTGCIAVIETKIAMTTAQIQALRLLAIKHCMVDRIVIFDDAARYVTNKTAWETNFPNNDVILNNVNTDSAYNTAKTITADRTANGLNTSVSTGFVYITDEKVSEYTALGGTFYYTEATSESDLESLAENSHIDCLRYIASSYFNINKWLMSQYSI